MKLTKKKQGCKNYFDMPQKEKEALIKRAAKGANEMQRETIEKAPQQKWESPFGNYVDKKMYVEDEIENYLKQMVSKGQRVGYNQDLIQHYKSQLNNLIKSFISQEIERARREEREKINKIQYKLRGHKQKAKRLHRENPQFYNGYLLAKDQDSMILSELTK